MSSQSSWNIVAASKYTEPLKQFIKWLRRFQPKPKRPYIPEHPTVFGDDWDYKPKKKKNK
jgi:hypothetical protein